MQRLDDAQELAAAEQLRAARRGDRALVVELALNRVRLWEKSGDLDEAERDAAEAAAAAAALPAGPATTVLRLRCAVTGLHVNRTIGRPDQRRHLTNQALDLADQVRLVDLQRDPALLRDLAAELGDQAPLAVVQLALRGAGVQDTGALSASLARLEDALSASEGATGALADRLGVSRTEGSFDWSGWIDAVGATRAGERVADLFEELSAEVVGDVRTSITAELRGTADAAYFA